MLEGWNARKLGSWEARTLGGGDARKRGGDCAQPRERPNTRRCVPSLREMRRAGARLRDPEGRGSRTGSGTFGSISDRAGLATEPREKCALHSLLLRPQTPSNQQPIDNHVDHHNRNAKKDLNPAGQFIWIDHRGCVRRID